MPEIWLYLRDFGSGRELVCKIFDSEPGWDAGEPLPVGAAVPAGPDSVRGRGLQMVAGLSAGRWGHHLSRGRLGAWKVQGKAVWFALRIPPGSDLSTSNRIAPRGSRAIAELAAALTDRGLGAGLVPVTEPSRRPGRLVGQRGADRLVPRRGRVVAGAPGRIRPAARHRPGRGRRADRVRARGTGRRQAEADGSPAADLSGEYTGR